MAFPTFSLEVAFTTAPLSSSPSWTDVTEYLKDVAITRGRQRELDTFDAGRMTVTLDNQDRRFDPSYSGTLTNLCANPSIETDTSGWAADGSAIARSNTEATKGSYSLRVITNGASNNEGAYYSASGLTNGGTYTFSVYVKGSGNLAVYLSDGYTTTQSATVAASGTWTRRELTKTINASATTLRCEVFTEGGAAAVTFYLDAAQVELASTASTYTDGDQDNCRWSGTAHASTSYRGGPYYGNLLPMRKIRLSVTVSATTYRLYTGYVTAWQQLWDTAFTADCRVDAIDIFDLLAVATLPVGTRASELSSARVTWALDQAGIPTADQAVTAGQSNVQALTVTSGSEPSALSHILDVADSELGAFFAGGDGRATFFDRHTTLKSPYTTSQATFGDTADSDIPYEALAPSYDRELIRNKAIVTRPSGTAQTASDATSITAYGTRVHQRSPLLTSDTEAADMASYLVAAYKDPALRFDAITYEPLESDTLWALVGGLEIWERVTVKRTPPGGGTAITQDCLIEGIEHRGIPDGSYWQTTYRLSPADPNTYWSVGDTVSSVLDTTTRLAY